MRYLAVIVAVLLASEASALDVSNRYRSPRNPERKVRKSTELIVLHTTEAPARSSLNKLSDRGEAHFCVTEEGTIYSIVDRDKEAFHAGRSMWNGKEDCDKFTIGIECVGYHDKPMSLVQLRAIASLVRELKTMYRLTDDKVVSHCHVAYGAPNKWHKTKHRGRKRCGMLFAMNSVRRILGLTLKPGADNDVRARRLVVGDAYLNRVLYSGVDTMQANYGKAQPVLTSVAAQNPRPPKAAAQSTGFLATVKRVFSPSVSAKSKTVASSVSKQSGKPSPPPRAKPNKAPVAARKSPTKPQTKSPPKTRAELKRRGYVEKGVVTEKKTAAQIAGKRWNSPETYYTIRDKVFSGQTINPARIEKGMTIWMKPQ